MTHAIWQSAACVVALFVCGQPLQAQDWSGFYGGLTLGSTSGESREFLSSSLASELQIVGDGQLGGFVGYNQILGSFVYGGELAFVGKDPYIGVPGFGYMNNMIDLKARVGVPSGRVLYYGVLGWSRAGRSFGGSAGDAETAADGLSIGLGLDALVSQNVFIGVEYLHRRLDIGSGEVDGADPDLTIEHDLDTISLRAGFKF